MREFQAMKTHIIARAAMRRLFKIGVTEGTKEAINRRRDPLLDILISLFGIAWTATERADLRCWSLLPASLQVMRAEMPAGEYDNRYRPLERRADPRGRTHSRFR